MGVLHSGLRGRGTRGCRPGGGRENGGVTLKCFVRRGRMCSAALIKEGLRQGLLIGAASQTCAHCVTGGVLRQEWSCQLENLLSSKT